MTLLLFHNVFSGKVGNNVAAFAFTAKGIISLPADEDLTYDKQVFYWYPFL